MLREADATRNITATPCNLWRPQPRPLLDARCRDLSTEILLFDIMVIARPKAKRKPNGNLSPARPKYPEQMLLLERHACAYVGSC